MVKQDKQRHFDRYVDFLLGEKCYGMLIPGPAGEKVPLSPPWHIMLDYEFELRKKAVRRAHRSGRPLHETLQEVTEATGLNTIFLQVIPPPNNLSNIEYGILSDIC